MTEETWYSKSDVIEATYTAREFDYAGSLEIDIEIHSIKILGAELTPNAVLGLTHKIKEEIAEDL